MADAALRAGHEAKVIPATLVRTLGVGARKTKTDRRDAQILSEVSTRVADGGDRRGGRRVEEAREKRLDVQANDDRA
jgi:hypothetical protein